MLAKAILKKRKILAFLTDAKSACRVVSLCNASGISPGKYRKPKGIRAAGFKTCGFYICSPSLFNQAGEFKDTFCSISSTFGSKSKNGRCCRPPPSRILLGSNIESKATTV